jgi:hypothetical protein
VPAIVINEWIFHDMRGENGLSAQVRVEAFLEALKDGADRIVVLRGSSWASKAWDMWNQDDANIQLLSKLLYLGILVDPRKCQYLEANEVQPLPPDLDEQVPCDDVYLFQTALVGNAEMIVTTDTRLLERVTNANRHGIRLLLRDDFFREYLDI